MAGVRVADVVGVFVAVLVVDPSLTIVVIAIACAFVETSRTKK